MDGEPHDSTLWTISSKCNIRDLLILGLIYFYKLGTENIQTILKSILYLIISDESMGTKKCPPLDSLSLLFRLIFDIQTNLYRISI